jgi:hypothetical protein
MQRWVSELEDLEKIECLKRVAIIEARTSDSLIERLGIESSIILNFRAPTLGFERNILGPAHGLYNYDQVTQFETQPQE